MNKATAIALEESIEHWERMRDAETPDDLGNEGPYGEDCPLCKMFSTPTNKYECDGCPVLAATGKSNCFGTPWRNAVDALSVWKRFHDLRDQWVAAADAEIEFLKSLREPT